MIVLISRLRFSLFITLGWVYFVNIRWVGSDWVMENGFMDNSNPDYLRRTCRKSFCRFVAVSAVTSSPSPFLVYHSHKVFPWFGNISNVCVHVCSTGWRNTTKRSDSWSVERLRGTATTKRALRISSTRSTGCRHSNHRLPLPRYNLVFCHELRIKLSVVFLYELFLAAVYTRSYTVHIRRLSSRLWLGCY